MSSRSEEEKAREIGEAEQREEELARKRHGAGVVLKPAPETVVSLKSGDSEGFKKLATGAGQRHTLSYVTPPKAKRPKPAKAVRVTAPEKTREQRRAEQAERDEQKRRRRTALGRAFARRPEEPTVYNFEERAVTRPRPRKRKGRKARRLVR